MQIGGARPCMLLITSGGLIVVVVACSLSPLMKRESTREGRQGEKPRTCPWEGLASAVHAQITAQTETGGAVLPTKTCYLE